ncbi:MAG: hypothetical protein EOR72_31345 [Mesorhizobium sp.]|uniref:hypothetical protein n=1 Tax=Mesorhizobium sp. TaxID=1871066 RepID=UPI000FE77366|nr:hypothetical protein [Mesorhizobium sp.]RWM06667.1 MAG: hypothetical protein EOR72_31345 [Mesorhizobium sp.]
MGDRLIMIIRHAEKPLAERPDRGVDELGQEDDKSLTVRGWQRAGALAHLFYNPAPTLQVPQMIVASAPVKKDGSGTRSLRPTQTITPLAQRLQIEPDTRYSKGQEKLAGRTIGQYDVPTLVCWQHESIPNLAAEIAQSTDVAPGRWDDDDYDSVWILSFSEAEHLWTFKLEQQRLLSGDKQ